MPTQLFFADITASEITPPGNLSSDFDLAMKAGRSAGVTNTLTSTVAGPTSGVQATKAGAVPLSWWYRVNAITIAGPITKNIWGAEGTTGANAGVQTIIDRCDSAGAFISTVENSEFGTELSGSSAVNNWSTGSVTSTIFATGDYLRIRLYANDAGGTMTAADSFTFYVGGTTAGASGDSYITFTEDISAYLLPVFLTKINYKKFPKVRMQQPTPTQVR